MDIPKGAKVAVDTNVWIWVGLRDFICGTNLDGAAPDKSRRARILLSELQSAQAQLIMPTMVVTELLYPIPKDRHPRFMSVVNARFLSQEFDVKAAALAADIWAYGRSFATGAPGERYAAKADACIVASAHCAGARFFYSDDKTCRKMAERAGMDARCLPSHRYGLFFDDEDEEGFSPLGPLKPGA